jgi:hypothetical protein
LEERKRRAQIVHESVAWRLLIGCLDCRDPATAEEPAHNDDLHGDDASDIVEIVSMIRKGRNKDGGAGTVLTRWIGAAPVTDAPSFQVRDVCNRLDLALLVVNFGDLVIDVTIENNLERAFTQRLPDLLRTSSRDGRTSVSPSCSAFFPALNRPYLRAAVAPPPSSLL